MLAFLVLALAAGLTGCKTEDKSVYTIDHQIRKMFGGDNLSPEEKAALVFNTSDPDVRRAGVEMLSRKKWALRDPYLKQFARMTRPSIEKDPSVRAVAVRALGKAHNRKYMPEILDALSDPSSVVRWDAAVVTQSMPDKKAISKLQNLAISDESIDVRSSAVIALQHYRSDSVYRTLLRCLGDNAFSVRNAAHGSLVYLTGRDNGYDPESWTNKSGKAGDEKMPEPVVRYKKRPWWDWGKVTKETEAIDPGR